MHRLLVALLLCSGCAFGIDGPDPHRPRSQPPQCDTNKGAVVLDAAVAVTAGLIAMSLLDSEPAVAVLPASIGALYLGGALKGNSNANKCRAANEDYAAYVAARETIPEEHVGRLRRPDPEPRPAPQRAAPVAAPPEPVAAASAVPAPVAPGPVASTSPTPTPAVTAPKPQPTKAQSSAKAEIEVDGDWSAFWREVP